MDDGGPGELAIRAEAAVPPRSYAQVTITVGGETDRYDLQFSSGADAFTDADADGQWDSGEAITTDHNGNGLVDAANSWRMTDGSGSTTKVAGAGGAVSIARGGVTVDIAAHGGAGYTEGRSFRFGVFKSAHKKNAVLLGLETMHATP